MPKPASKPDWTVGNPDFATVTQEPTAQKKEDGWQKDERPPREFMNWLFWNIDQWIDYLESATDTAAGGQYKAIVGTGGTHATLAAALADANVTSKSKILVISDATVNSTITVAKDNLVIEFLPGVTYTKGSATTGIQVTADGVEIHRGRFADFSSGGDKAVEFAAGADFGIIYGTRFANNDTDISDVAGNTHQLAIHVES